MKKEWPPGLKAQLVNAYIDDEVLRQTAELEAMMTFIKRRTDAPGAARIFIDKRTADTREQLFHFGRIFAETMAALESGAMDVIPEIKETFRGK